MGDLNRDLWSSEEEKQEFIKQWNSIGEKKSIHGANDGLFMRTLNTITNILGYVIAIVALILCLIFLF